MELKNNNKTMTVKEFCAEYGIGINKGYEIINCEGFPMLKIGRKILIIRSKLDLWFENQVGRIF
ncbi:helix-turn-helix domain-containing protein [Clostridium butyricum]